MSRDPGTLEQQCDVDAAGDVIAVRSAMVAGGPFPRAHAAAVTLAELLLYLDAINYPLPSAVDPMLGEYRKLSEAAQASEARNQQPDPKPDPWSGTREECKGCPSLKGGLCTDAHRACGARGAA